MSEPNCPACREKRLHTEQDWLNHPHRGHGFNGYRWTHPELEAEAAAKRDAPNVTVIPAKTKGAGA